MMRKSLPVEVLVELRRRLDVFPARSHARREAIKDTAAVYGISEATLYRALQQGKPETIRRVDRGNPRILPSEKMEKYCELIAAIKVRSSNKKGRCLSTGEAIRLLEEYGVHTPDGLMQPQPGLLTVPTVNRYLKQWGYDRSVLWRQPPAVRFQAQHSNECWHFDLSPSDIKHINTPSWVREDGGKPQLMLYSVVDDRSGMAYMEYHCVYGEDVEAGLRFLFNAMSEKSGLELCGIPKMLYMDNGPIGRSRVFQKVMSYLGIEVKTHLPAGKDGTRVTTRSKGKVERPFRSVKEMYETLFHFHEPQTEEEANAGLKQYLVRYNSMDHRSEPHSRMEDWLENVPVSGVRKMCSWERFCTFAREPERRKVGIDTRISVNGTVYEVDADLAGETVVLWWGLFDNELYVEQGERRFGPYSPVGGPILLHRYRTHKKTRYERRAERVESLAGQLKLSRDAVLSDGFADLQLTSDTSLQLQHEKPFIPFADPDPFQEFTYPTSIVARHAVADYLGMPLAKLPPSYIQELDTLLERTLNKQEILGWVREYLKPIVRRAQATECIFSFV